MTSEDLHVGLECYLTFEEQEQDGYSLRALAVARTKSQVTLPSGFEPDGQAFTSRLDLGESG